MPLQIIRNDITKIECDAIVNAANETLLGGDSDTLGVITGAIAWSFYKAQNGGNLSPDMESLKSRQKLT